MTARRSRLDAVLRVRRLQEERAKGELLRAQCEEARAVEVASDRRSAFEALPPAPATEVTPVRFLTDRAVRSLSATAVSDAQHGVRAAGEHREVRRQDWSTAAQRASAVERLDERHRAAVRAELLHREQAAADEVAVSRWAREVR